MKRSAVVKVVLTMLLVVALFPCMARQAHAVLAIENGSQWMSSDAPKWTLEEGEGIRRVVIPIKFSEPFLSAPKISLSFNYLDTDNTFNQRIKVEAKRVTTTGYNMVLTTWYDSIIWAVGVSWIAIGDR
jgi:hypothetical protein